MAKKNQQVYPMELTDCSPKTDVEFAALQSEELRPKGRLKSGPYLVAFAVFQSFVILLLVLTFMRIRTPKFRLRSVAIQSLSYSANKTSPSFNIRFNVKISVKNANFGHFRFQNTTIKLAYRGISVGEVSIAKGRARARSTKKRNAIVDVTSDKVMSHSSLVRDLNSGFLIVTSQGKLSGRVHLIKLMKRKKSAKMNCVIKINLADKTIKDLKCR